MDKLKNVHILILNWRDIKHPLGGGAELSLHEHAKFWVKNGAEVFWFSSSFAGYKDEEKIDGINFIRRGSQYTVHLFAFLNYIQGGFGKINLIIDSYHGIPFFTPLYVRNSKIIPLINEVAGSIWFLNTFLPFAVIGFILELLSFKIYSDKKFITASNSTLEALINKGINKKNIYVIPHGVTIEKVNKNIIKEKQATLVFLSRVTEDKGIEDALKAFEKILNYFKVQFWIIGKEEKKGYLKQLMNSVLSKKNHKLIKYFGFIDQGRKFELLKRAWILVHPSKKEGWGLNVIEAGSQSTPAVGYDVEGLRDSVQNNKTGLLSHTNPDDLANKLLDLLKNKQKRMKMGEAARKWSSEFTWQKSTQKSLNLLMKLIK